jgi:hypothetical protein
VQQLITFSAKSTAIFFESSVSNLSPSSPTFFLPTDSTHVVFHNIGEVHKGGQALPSLVMYNSYSF